MLNELEIEEIRTEINRGIYDNKSLLKLVDEEIAVRHMLPDANTPKTRASGVYNGKCIRVKKALMEKEKALKQKDNNELRGPDDIVKLVNAFLALIDMEKTASIYEVEQDEIDYNNVNHYDSVSDPRDIIWMKFARLSPDEYALGVVASSNDINFESVANPDCDYESIENCGKSGIIVTYWLKMEWETSFVVVVPLVGIPENLTRGCIEAGIGNYLISKNVPILDYYSHNYPC